MMNNIEEFRKLFNEFEDETKKKLNYKYDKIGECISILADKRRNPYFNERSFIEFCTRLRNIASHNNNDNYYLITEDTITKFKEVLNEVKHPYNVYSKATKNIYSKTINDKVLPTMNEMNEKSYTHIPIYDTDNKTLVGIFSENSLFQFLSDDDHFIALDEHTTFDTIRKCIDLDKTKEIVKFVSKDKLYDDVVSDFIKEFKEGNKLACIMVTENGKKTEKVIGIITSWDVIGRW